MCIDHVAVLTMAPITAGDWTKVHLSSHRVLSEDHVRRNQPLTRLAVLVFSAWVLLVGCTGPVHSYSKAGSDVADFRRDSDSCVQEPRVSWLANGSLVTVTVGTSVDAKRQDNMYRRCMEASGWVSEAPQ